MRDRIVHFCGGSSPYYLIHLIKILNIGLRGFGVLGFWGFGMEDYTVLDGNVIGWAGFVSAIC